VRDRGPLVMLILLWRRWRHRHDPKPQTAVNSWERGPVLPPEPEEKS
jgi:hypothetical protein